MTTGRRIVATWATRCRLKRSLTMTVLNSLLSLSKEELVARLQAAEKPRALTLKVGTKGGVSLYGVGRFPVTLYAGQWERVLDNADAIRKFILANADLVARKA